MGTLPYAWSGVDGQGNVRAGSGMVETQDAVARKVIGMSAPSGLWNIRIGEVGPAGVKARRIFADLVSDGQDQASLISAAKTAGMMPVVSYKLPVSGGAYRIAEALSGAFDSWVTALGNYLDALDIPVAVVFHHEPRGDLAPADFVALNKRYIPLVRRSPDIKVGCFINGFMLDGSAANKAEFASYTDTALLSMWDWFGIDAYHAGTSAAPDPVKTPGSRMRLTRDWLAARGKASMPIGIGEYNGHTTAAVADAGEAALSISSMWFACVWNSTGEGFVPLSGARLAAYQATKADPRAVQ